MFWLSLIWWTVIRHTLKEIEDVERLFFSLNVFLDTSLRQALCTSSIALNPIFLAYISFLEYIIPCASIYTAINIAMRRCLLIFIVENINLNNHTVYPQKKSVQILIYVSLRLNIYLPKLYNTLLFSPYNNNEAYIL